MRFHVLTSVVALAVLAAAAPHSVRQGTGVAIPITKRSELLNPDKSVNLDALNAELASTKGKVLRGLDNYEKNTGILHPGALKGTQKRDTGTVNLTNYQYKVWYGTISVGYPATDFTVQFDIGSSDLILPGHNCTSNCDGHKAYDPDDSLTAGDLCRTFHLSHGEYTRINGELYSDTVTVAGLTAVGQTLGVAKNYSSNLAVNVFPSDGLLGMGFQSLSVYNASPVFQTLVSQFQTSVPAFSFKIASNGSELYLGGANSELYTGKFTHVPVIREVWWEVNMDSISSNGKTVKTNIDSVIDTGTTLIVVPPSDAAEFYKVVGGTDASSTLGPGYYTFPCDSFPTIHFTFGGTPFLFSAETMNIGPVNPGSNDCISAIAGVDLGFSFWVVGASFLENVYTTFVVGDGNSQSMVGFAQLA